MNIDLQTQIKCIKREIAIRKRVYPRWIDQEKMNIEDAKNEIETMEAVLETLSKYESMKEGLGI